MNGENKTGVCRNDGVMSFDEIGEVLGMTKVHVQWCYYTAMAKFIRNAKRMGIYEELLDSANISREAKVNQSCIRNALLQLHVKV